MTTRLHFRRYSWLIIISLLVSCGTLPSGNQPADPSVFTPVAQTSTASPAEETPPVPSPTAVPPAVPAGLRMAYIIDGNLYFQSGGNPSVEMTSSGVDRKPLISEDGKKILFYRGWTPHELYALDAAGGREQALVTNKMLMALGLGYDKSTAVQQLSFVPNTHLLLFNTGNVDLSQPQTGPFISNHDLLLMDMDTLELKVLLSPGKGGGFRLSPDGKLVAILAKGHVDLIDLNGRMIRRNLVTYTPTYPYELVPGMVWNSASTELIVALPAGEIYDMGGPEPFFIWRYAIDRTAKIQLSFSPPVLEGCCASPDGKWFLYEYYYYPGKTSDQIPGGLYLGNMDDSNTQYYGKHFSAVWSPDSIHFMFDDGGLYLGTVNAQPGLIDKGRFMGWLDGNRYLYFQSEENMIMLGELGKMPIPVPVGMPADKFLARVVYFDYVLVENKTGN